MHSVACLRVLIQGSLSVISQSSYDHIKQKLHQILFKYLFHLYAGVFDIFTVVGDFGC